MRIVREAVIVNRIVEVILKDKETGEMIPPFYLPMDIADLINGEITKEKFDKKCTITVLLKLKQMMPKRKFSVESVEVKN
jgi:hypothetical protein